MLQLANTSRNYIPSTYVCTYQYVPRGGFGYLAEGYQCLHSGAQNNIGRLLARVTLRGLRASVSIGVPGVPNVLGVPDVLCVPGVPNVLGVHGVPNVLGVLGAHLNGTSRNLISVRCNACIRTYQ